MVAGRPPKQDGRKINTNPTLGFIEVPDVPYQGERPNPGRLNKRAAEWWAVVSTMPHCVLWTPADWQYAVSAAWLYNEMIGKKRYSIAGEIRQREAKMGLTIDDRRALRIRYVNPLAGREVEETQDEPEGDGKPSDFEARRRRRLLAEGAG